MFQIRRFLPNGLLPLALVAMLSLVLPIRENIAVAEPISDVMTCDVESDDIMLGDYHQFSDVNPGDWYVTSGVLDYVVDNGLIMGYGGTNRFGPFDTITRGQVATILYRMAGEPAGTSQPFDDVDYSEYYGPAIRWARFVGVINGYAGTNRFGPDDPVTREQLVGMLANYTSKVADITLGRNYYEGSSALGRYDDRSSVSRWAKNAIIWALGNGLMSGDPSSGVLRLNPQGLAQRCQAAKMITVLHRDVLFHYLIGSWKGDFVKTSPTGQYACYAGKSNPIEITFNSLDVRGRTANADIKVLAHYHWSEANSPNGTSGDRIIELKNITLNMSYLNFYNSILSTMYTIDDTSDCDIKISIDENQRISIVVSNETILGAHISGHSDRYILVKQ